MYRTNIYLEAEQVRALRHLAAEERRSVAQLIRQAVDQYLVREFQDRKDWGERFDDLVARIQQRIPANVTPEEIEADITAAREEVRQERRAERQTSLDARGR
ncbi:MAG TPA: CopG family transcriptional regulator [Chloroflexota bacterium]|nr:CopG family transcriptional regulator [Chloroflexota bacterium]